MNDWKKVLEELTPGREETIKSPLYEKTLLIFSLIEKEFANGDPYAVWKAIFFCVGIGCDFPDWVRFELHRISGCLLEIDQEVVGTNYPAYLSEVLGLKFKRKTEEAKRQKARRSTQCREMIKDGLRRTDIVDILSQCLNRRDAEKIYDAIKYQKAYAENLEKTDFKPKLLTRNTPPQK